VLIVLMFGFFKKPRRENLAMMWRGAIDGARGISGPLID